MRRGRGVTLLVGLLLAGTVGVRALAAGAVVGFPSAAVRVDVDYHPQLFATGTPGTITDPAAIATIAAVYNASGPAFLGACTVAKSDSTGTFTVTTQEGTVLPGEWNGCQLDLQGDPASPRAPAGFGATISATLALSRPPTVTVTPPPAEATATSTPLPAPTTPTVPGAPSSPTPTASALRTRTAVPAAAAVPTATGTVCPAASCSTTAQGPTPTAIPPASETAVPHDCDITACALPGSDTPTATPPRTTVIAPQPLPDPTASAHRVVLRTRWPSTSRQPAWVQPWRRRRPLSRWY